MEYQDHPTVVADDHHAADDHDAEQTDQLLEEGEKENMGARQRTHTSKSQGEKIRNMKYKRISSLGAVTKKRNKISQLMTTEKNIHLVKRNFEELIDLFDEYEQAYLSYCEQLNEVDVEDETEQFEEKSKAMTHFKRKVRGWINIMEQRLQDDIDRISEVGSKTSRSSSSSSKSARAKEKAKLAELMVEKSMMRAKQELLVKQQELLVKQQELAIDIEIAKAKAREKAYAEDIDDIISIGSAHGEYQRENQNEKEDQFETDQSRYADRKKSSQLDPCADPYVPHIHDKQNDQQHFMSIQQEQNAQILAAHRMLAAAVSLPQPEVIKLRGDSIEYNTFIRSFDARIVSLTSTDTDRLYHLEQHLEGEARDLIGGCMYIEPCDGYREARLLLAKEYGDPYKVSMAYINKALAWSLVKYDDSKALKRFSFYLIKCNHAMQSISHMSVLNHAPNMQAIVQKLPTYLQNKWRDMVSKMRTRDQRLATFYDLVQFVQQAAESAIDPIYGKEALSKGDQAISCNVKLKPKSRQIATRQQSTSFATDATPAKLSSSQTFVHSSDKTKKYCQFCKGSHDIDDCNVFNKKSMDDKRSYIKEKRLCFACYGFNHTSKGCLRKRTCTKCGKRHPTALHIDGYVFKTSNTEDSDDTKKTDHDNRHNVSTAACNTNTAVNTVLHAILPVRVQQKGSKGYIETYAFYDNGSSGCFLTEELEKDLNASSRDTTLHLRTMYGTSYMKSRIVQNLIVADINGQNAIQLPKAFTREVIPVNHQQIPRQDVIKKWSHLSEIEELIPKYMPQLKIGLLIGSNCPTALEPLQAIPVQKEGPFAVLLRHGWTINGPLRISIENEEAICNRIVFREKECIKEVPQPSVLLKMFERDFSEHDVGDVPGELCHSKEDKKFLITANQCTKDSNGHYVIPLPFRKQSDAMPNNRNQAITRANWQKKKMLREPKYRKDYITFVEAIIKKGYAIKINEQNSHVCPGNVWYLPHHGIYHPKKPEKIRVVFDCSAQFHGISLNDQLLQSPDLTNSLIGVLSRFREETIAFMGDIESMFYQVNVPTEQQDFLRFMWWPNGNLDLPMEEYKMTVHLFGAVSSPSICNFALKRTADESETRHGLLASNTIRRNFYVDDCLKSVQDEEIATQLVEDVRAACASGGFKLTKFTSNSCILLNSLPLDVRSKEIQTRNIDYDELPVERALGILWSVEQDEFRFSVTIPAKPPTRRGILSVISSIYDPLGFLAPYILSAKKILQELCQESQLGWDDKITDEHQNRWSKWLQELHHIENVSIKRCLKPPEFGHITSRELHVFSDASSIGYGCASYLRLCNSTGATHTCFLMGKARLSPVKKTTIPRLELTAATVAVKIGKIMNSELEVKPDSIVYHTDSTTVLHYIHSEKKRFPVFVANRVQLIQDYSETCQWRYVDSKSNPADIASRGLSSPDLLQTRWIDGPSFLKNRKETWPVQPVDFQHLNQEPTDYAQETDCNALNVDQSINSVYTLINHYSDWYKLKKAVAVFMKLRKTLLNRKTQMTASNAPLSTADLKKAEEAIVKFIQAQHFAEEIRTLQQNVFNETEISQRGREKNRVVSKSSSIYRLDPFLDNNGLLRVGGRLCRAEDMKYEMKHPLLLPPKGHVSMLIARDVHQKLSHAGRNHVLSTIREKYWIVKANSLVRHVLSKCVPCRRTRKPVAEQKMADLPADRLNATTPFTYTGVDFFGPFTIKEGRKEMKRYGALFTCLVSRAIHIETANSLDTDSFLNALRRFIARRGAVQRIRCDNGTNFVGARRKLWNALSEMDHSSIREQLLKQDIDWKFNPPTASHMGGVWERQIRTVRKILSPMLKEFGERLDEESFRTLLCEVEAIVNSRPLTTVSNDPDDLNPLTPNSLLTMKANVPMPPPGNFQRNDVCMRKRWRRVQYLSNLFWSRWKREYLQTLQTRQKWNHPKRSMQVGDVVIVKDENTPRNHWCLGRICKTEPDGKGFVRSVVLRTKNSELRRPIDKLVLILPVEEQC